MNASGDSDMKCKLLKLLSSKTYSNGSVKKKVKPPIEMSTFEREKWLFELLNHKNDSEDLN
jgi:hypothetical protein